MFFSRKKTRIKKLKPIEITGSRTNRKTTMDAFQRIAHSFKEDCQKKLETLEMASTIMDSSATVAEALRLIFVHSEIYPGDYEQMSSMAHEIDRLRNCIEYTDVSRPSQFFNAFAIPCLNASCFFQETVAHARKLFAINFNSTDKLLVFNQEICYSYACKMLNSVGPRLIHFSNAPTPSEIVDAELYLALNSPYTFNVDEDDLFCYESMPFAMQAEQ